MQSIYAGKYKKHTIEQTNFHWVGIKMSETGEYLINFQISACFCQLLSFFTNKHTV